jgi:hypothetical protein
MIGIASAVWDEPGEWSLTQRERAQTRAYLNRTDAGPVPGLTEVGRCVSLHDERLDRSGYPHGLHGEATSLPVGILGAVDIYQALRQPRPRRSELGAAEAERMMREEVRARRLDGECLNAVLEAAGHRVRRRAGPPSGLTAREVEVLVRLGQGRLGPETPSNCTSASRRSPLTSTTSAPGWASRHAPAPPCSPCATDWRRQPASLKPGRKMGQLPDSPPLAGP